VHIRNLTILAATAAFMAFSVASPSAIGGKPAAKKDEGPKLPPAKIEDIHVGGVWTRAARKGEKTHIFMTIENKGPVPVRLRGGETDIAKYIQLVRFRMQGAYMLTRMVGPVAVEPHEKYTFEPGIVGLELRELHKDLRRGEVLPLTLEFAGIGAIKVEAEVDSRTAVRYPPPDELPPAKEAH
tara:strand:- start:10527 stop:11075 length:549 start_codon:yes stop_codon:yes gene_type:complete